MGLTRNHIIQEITDRKKSRIIDRAIIQQNRIRFHSEVNFTPKLTQPATVFLSWVSSLIPKSKFEIFKQFFKFPLSTNEVTKTIFTKLSRIFDGRNPAFNYQFINTEQRDDWEWYRQEILNEPNVWQSLAWKNFKDEINSIMIIDLNENQTTRLPEPYLYWLPISDVISYNTINEYSSQMDFIIFKQKNDRIAVIDNERYRMFEFKNDSLGLELINNPHDLKYCPARFFWDTPIKLDEYDIKQSPLSDQLTRLDDYLFNNLSRKHLKLYASYPIYSGYRQECNFSDETTGNYCDGGHMKNNKGYYLFKDNELVVCPKCTIKKISGAGSFIEVPVPTEGQPDLQNPVKMLGADVDTLIYNRDEDINEKNSIIYSVVGNDEDVVTREAVNELQIDATYQSANQILNDIKKGFEDAQTWANETECRLRYGNNYFVSANINYGTEFYTLSVDTLRNRYKQAKDNGASEAELDALSSQILETEYRHNPIQLQRMLILQELEPYRHYSRDEILTLSDKGLINNEDLQIKLNFNNFVKRFERENINIIEYESDKPFDYKISLITNKFRNYVNESR